MLGSRVAGERHRSHTMSASAIVKTKLKHAKEALVKKNYEKARSASADVLDYEPDNYNA